MEIRPGRKEDAPVAAELIQETMEGTGDVLLGLGDRTRAVQAIAGFFRYANNRFSHRVAHVAEVDGQVAGLLLAYPGRDLRRLMVPMALQMWSLYNFWDILRLSLRARMAAGGEECLPDEFFIAQLAVLPTFRKRGIGRALLVKADELGRAARLDKCSLCVDIDNPAAQKLYESHGYRVIKTISTPWLKDKLNTRGYRRMVKSLK